MIYEIAHQIGLIPIALMLIAGRGQPASHWLVAIAFAVSWLGDSAAQMLGGSWAGTYAWLPVQFALVVSAFERRPIELALVLWAVGLAGFGSWLLSAPGPDWLLTVFGSVVVCVLARGAIGAPVLAYFGAGTIAYCWMLTTMDTDIMPAWLTYQACRLVAFGAFAAIVLYRRTHGNVHDGMAARARDRLRGVPRDPAPVAEPRTEAE